MKELRQPVAYHVRDRKEEVIAVVLGQEIGQSPKVVECGAQGRNVVDVVVDADDDG